MADVVPITPTEPVPADPGSSMTYAQGERLIQLMTDFKGAVSEGFSVIGQKLDSAVSLLTDIKTNTTPVHYDTGNVPPTNAMTVEQGAQILHYLDLGGEIVKYAIVIGVLWFTIKWLYRFFGGTLFGGL
jgi:hypothetical protein